MYEMIKEVILAGGYKLAEIQRKVKKLYCWGDITEAQADELLAMAAAGVSPEAERPEVLTMLRGLADRLTACESRLAALEGAEPDADEYEEWKPWDGLSNQYQLGAIVRHNGKLWESTFNGQNTWEPGTLGTDALWKEYSE